MEDANEESMLANVTLRSALRRTLDGKRDVNSVEVERKNRKSVDICPIIAVRCIRIDGETSDTLDYLKLTSSKRKRRVSRQQQRMMTSTTSTKRIIMNNRKFLRITTINQIQFEKQYQIALQDASDASILMKRLCTDRTPVFHEDEIHIKASLIASLARIERRNECERNNKRVKIKEIDIAHYKGFLHRLFQSINNNAKRNIFNENDSCNAYEQEQCCPLENPINQFDFIRDRQQRLDHDRWTPIIINNCELPFNLVECKNNKRRSPSIGNRMSSPNINTIFLAKNAENVLNEHSKPKFLLTDSVNSNDFPLQ